MANNSSIEDYQRKLADIQRKLQQGEALTKKQDVDEQLRLNLAVETISVLKDFLEGYLAPLGLDPGTLYRFDMYRRGSGSGFIWFGEYLATYPRNIMALLAQTQMTTIAVAIQRNNLDVLQVSPMQFICDDVAYRFEVYTPDSED